MNDRPSIVRVEVGFDPTAAALISNLTAAILTLSERWAAPAMPSSAPKAMASPEIAAPIEPEGDDDDTLSQVEAELEAEEAVVAPAARRGAIWSPKRRAQVLQRIDGNGEKIADLAAEWGLTHGAVKIQLWKARQALKATQPVLAPAARAEPEPTPKALPPIAEPAANAARSERFQTTHQEREAWLQRREAGESTTDLATKAGVDRKTMENVLFRARQARILTLQTAQAVQTAVVAKPAGPAPDRPEPTQASMATPSLSRSPSLPPSAAPERPIRRDLAAEMAEFEARKGVTKLPTIAEIAEAGVPSDFINIPVATDWLIANGHTVKKAGSMAYRIDETTVRASDFIAQARLIARNRAVAILAERRAK